MFTDLSFNIYSLALIFSASFACLLSLWISRKKGPIFRWFSLMLGASAWWAMAYGFELASSNLVQMLFWIKMEYLGISTLPSLFLIFCYSFIGRTSRLVSFTYMAVFGYSLITYLVVFTNDYHQLFYASTSVDTSGPFPLLAIQPGPWYHIHTVIFYVLVGVGYWALIDNMRHTRKVFVRQNRLLVIGTLVPLLVNFGYIFFDVRPYGHVDLTPFAFLFTSFIIAIGLLRFGLFDISQTARSRVISELGDGVVVIDAFQRIIDYNLSFQKVLRSDDEDLIGLKLHELFPNEKLPADFLDDQVLENGALMIQAAGGRHFELSITGLYEKGGVVNGAALLFKDVSGRIEAQVELLNKTMELQKLNGLKDRLFSIIAHDLRGPLLNLQEVMTLVNQGILSETEREDMFKVLSDNVDQSVALMQNLLIWAQSQQKGEKLSLSSFNLKDLVLEVQANLKPILDKKIIQLILNVNEGTQVFADREMIQIVIRNLVSNAAKFTNESGAIEIACDGDDSNCWVHVKDQGVGMSPDVLSRLRAEEMYSSQGTASEEGSGLGLVLCRDFIRKNGGNLQIESEQGAGSTFSFNIPLSK